LTEQLSVQEAIARDHVEMGTQMFFAITDVPDDEWHRVHVEVGPPGWAQDEGWCFEYHEPRAGFIQLPGWKRAKPAIYGAQANGVVNLGLQMALDKLSGVTAPANLSNIGIASDTAAVTATTVFLGGGVAAILSGGTQNGFIRAFNPAATRSNQVLTAGATFTQADMAGAAFVIHKVGLLNAATDVGTGLGAGPASGIFDVIGGTGGSAPFNQPFTIDLTGTTTWSLLMQIQVTAANA
jgi:hypothetical protein